MSESTPEPAADSAGTAEPAAPPDLKAAPDTSWLKTETVRGSQPPPDRENTFEGTALRDEQ